MSRFKPTGTPASPLLAGRTPTWRSRFVMAFIALCFVGLGARAAYVQVWGNDFYKRQGYEEIGEVAVGPIREHVFFHPNPQVVRQVSA